MRRRISLICGAIWFLQSGISQAQVVQEFVLHQANPHADILPHPLYNAWTPYRKVYNRPRPIGGYLAYWLEPTSQEAMAWDENVHEGNYTHPRKPAHYHIYNYPKPWEALNVDARHDSHLTQSARPTEPADQR